MKKNNTKNNTKNNMNNKLKVGTITLSLVSVLFLTGCNSQKGTLTEKGKTNKIAKRIVVIGLDGLSIEGYKTAKHPNLDQLMTNGTLSLSTRSVMPSVTLPNWTSHLTGSGPEQHGVDSNAWTVKEHILAPVEQDNEGYYPSIFKVLKERLPNMKTAYYYNWGNLINSINKKYLDEINFEEEDKYQKNYNLAFQFVKNHQKEPTLVFLYSVHTDHAGHNHSWMSTAYITAIEEADKEIGALMTKLKTAGLYEDTHFMLITDHGGKGSGHGGMSPVEMQVPWGVTGPGIQKGKILAEPSNNNDTAVVILRLFGFMDKPKAWTGEVPESIFENNQVNKK
jgi:predicted AlkP superfamily pyrophosphatase or phosphodiesterase